LQEFEEKYHGQFTWQHIEESPGMWFISIVKKGKDNITVRDILDENPKAYEVLRKYNLDAYCKGNLLFSDACKEADVSRKKIISEIEEVKNNERTISRINQWPLDFLTEYIIMNHHNFLTERINVIHNLLRELQNKEGKLNLFIFQLNLAFINVQDALKKHIQEEEEVIFPAIKLLVLEGSIPQNLPLYTLQKTITFLQDEDKEVIAGLKHIRKITKNYTYENNLPGINLLFNELEEFEIELFYHMHIENNILFPKIIFLEDEANIWND
jgi:regulator of cell morphogenesis and NO signaling